jgi:hypothetical protein
MKMSMKRMSIGWSFVLGMLFGALLVFARIGASSGGHASPPRSPELSVPAAPLSITADQKEAEAKPSPVVSAAAKSRSKMTPSRQIRHPECELQLE